ncbi:MAG: molybdopterin-binding protein [Clostridiales bacterium]|uniref:molybdopterin-binding protein n=1 Tax=Terrisporobacter sp. TaxID=1965305 RepID=UPI002A50DDD5|nr:molybdopterin-binding protein [Terrisporobacter sp.]MCI7204773.1 molybdopterin-binding protein [Clostridium sp.]MDD7755659.1 molybdopterin-binding protein [Clostridiales bacterium]MDY4135203.1 molybdopterin-binding protein [Terrisporobacter sp.]
MKQIRIEDAVGCILSHDVTKIVPGEFKGRLFKKGHVIKEEDIEKLLDIGKEHIYVWEPKENELHENDAAIRIKDLVLGEGCTISEEIKEGKIDFFADRQGVLKINKDLLLKLNMVGEIIVSTMHNNTPVKKGEKIGATRVIPLIINEEKIIEAENLIREKIIRVEEIKPKKAVLITTGNEVYKGRIKDAFLPVMEEKLGYYGSEIIRQVILPDDKEMISENIIKAIEEDKVDVVICTGGMSVDPDDVTPSAIKDCNGEIVTYGAPVLPGAMFLLAYYKNTPILGVPSCAMYAKRTILDLVLPRVLADEKLTFEDIASYGNGGMCLSCEICSFPHCSFGK